MKAVETAFLRIVGCRTTGLATGVNNNEEGISGPSSPSALCRLPRRRADLQQVEREPISTLAKG
jgi:hypothetical protein